MISRTESLVAAPVDLSITADQLAHAALGSEPLSGTSPRLAVEQSADHRARDPEPFGNLPLPQPLVASELADLCDLLHSEPDPGPPVVAQVADLVDRLEMLRVHAARVLALVMHVVAIGHRPDVLLVHDLVRPPAMAIDGGPAVAAKLEPLPLPAARLVVHDPLDLRFRSPDCRRAGQEYALLLRGLSRATRTRLRLYRTHLPTNGRRQKIAR